jgi:hypothetical protein
MNKSIFVLAFTLLSFVVISSVINVYDKTYDTEKYSVVAGSVTVMLGTILSLVQSLQLLAIPLFGISF